MKSIVIQSGLRLFRRTAGPVLARTNEVVPAGSRIRVGEEETLHYDHRSQQALTVEWDGANDGVQRYVLKSEYLQSWIS